MQRHIQTEAALFIEKLIDALAGCCS